MNIIAAQKVNGNLPGLTVRTTERATIKVENDQLRSWWALPGPNGEMPPVRYSHMVQRKVGEDDERRQVPPLLITRSPVKIVRIPIPVMYRVLLTSQHPALCHFRSTRSRKCGSRTLFLDVFICRPEERGASTDFTGKGRRTKLTHLFC